MYEAFIKAITENGQPIFPKKIKLHGPHEVCPTVEVDGTHLTPCICRKSVEQLKKDLNDDFEFSCQYRNNPIDENLVEFKRAWLKPIIFTDKVNVELAASDAILSVDPAFRLKETNDYTGLVVTKTLSSGFVCILEAYHKRMNGKDLVDEIFKLIRIYKPYKVLIETVGAQLLLLDLLRDEMRKRNEFFVIEEVKTSTKETKAVKIRALIPHYANGRILHRNGLSELESELVEFPRGSHDDIVDALSFQVPYWKSYKKEDLKEEAPYWSMNWWKKQSKSDLTPLGEMFKDLIPPRM